VKKQLSGLFLFFCISAAVTGMMLYPQEISGAVTDCFALCTDQLLPTLFPFMILSGFIIRSGAAEQIGERISPLSQYLFHLPGVSMSAFLMGAAGGYPTGAKAAAELYRTGAYSREEAEHTLAFCSNCGPGFLLGSIGYGLFGSVRYGLLLYITHIVSALLTGVLLSPSNSVKYRGTHRPQGNTPLIYTAFVNSVTDAIGAFINLSAFLLCFSAILRLITLSGVPTLLTSLMPPNCQNGEWFLLGLIEMTSGIFHMNAGSLWERLILTSALVSWSGLSVHCQILSQIQDTDLSLTHYWKGKFLQSLLSPLLTAAALGCLPLYKFGSAAGVAALFYFFKKAVAKKETVYYN